MLGKELLEITKVHDKECDTAMGKIRSRLAAMEAMKSLIVDYEGCPEAYSKTFDELKDLVVMVCAKVETYYGFTDSTIAKAFFSDLFEEA